MTGVHLNDYQVQPEALTQRYIHDDGSADWTDESGQTEYMETYSEMCWSLAILVDSKTSPVDLSIAICVKSTVSQNEGILISAEANKLRDPSSRFR